jgi:hypothetical protein
MPPGVTSSTRLWWPGASAPGSSGWSWGPMPGSIGTIDFRAGSPASSKPGSRGAWLIEGSASTVNRGRGLEFGAWRAETRYLLVEQRRWPVALAAVAEYERRPGRETSGTGTTGVVPRDRDSGLRRQTSDHRQRRHGPALLAGRGERRGVRLRGALSRRTRRSPPVSSIGRTGSSTRSAWVPRRASRCRTS